jgi:hypothetical protein
MQAFNSWEFAKLASKFFCVRFAVEGIRVYLCSSVVEFDTLALNPFDPPSADFSAKSPKNQGFSH